MNDYTLYLVKRAYYKKQLIKRAFMNKYALSEESAKNINPSLLERFKVYQHIGEDLPGTGSIANRYIQNEMNEGKSVSQGINSLLRDVYSNSDQGWTSSIRQYPATTHFDIPVGSNMTRDDYFNMFNTEGDRWDRRGKSRRQTSIDRHNKKISGSKSTALVPYVAPVARSSSRPNLGTIAKKTTKVLPGIGPTPLIVR